MRLVSPHRSIIGAGVAGTVDADYVPAWLTDGLPGYPAYVTGGSLSLTATPAASLPVDVIAVVNHTIKQAATISLSGSLSGGITTAPWRSDGIPLNWVRVLTTPVTASSIGLGVTGNSGPVIVGELYAGTSSVFPDFLAGRRFTPKGPAEWEGEYSSLAPYDKGIAAQRRVSGTLVLTNAEFADLEDIHAAQRDGHLPVLFVENDIVNDAWLCQCSFEATHNELWHFVQLDITEIPRLRW